MDSIAKAEKRIKLLSEKVGASDEGVLWLKEVLDPFSDTPRRPVGFPDLITGNSVIQVVKQSKTISIGATPQDVHIFMDTCETDIMVADNEFKNPPNVFGGAIEATAVGGVTATYHRGGTIVRSGPVGSRLTTANTTDRIQLPPQYCESGATRVIAKAIEIHNVTNKLNVGGTVTVYRDTGAIPYGEVKAVTCYDNTNETYSITHDVRQLSNVPDSTAAVTRIPGSQAWEAEDGAYLVGTMAAQTNNPADEEYKLVITEDFSNADGHLYANITKGSGSIPGIPELYPNVQLFSPFFLSGAYFSGLPAGTQLTINTIHIIERFVDTSNLDLVVLAQPSPYYDPVAMEIYSKTCMKLPHGVKVGTNADGDWIKEVADVLGAFGVPGMPLIKGAVDVYNMVGNRNQPKKETAEQRRIAELEEKLARYVGSPSKSNVPMLEKKKVAPTAVKSKPVVKNLNSLPAKKVMLTNSKSVKR